MHLCLFCVSYNEIAGTLARLLYKRCPTEEPHEDQCHSKVWPLLPDHEPAIDIVLHTQERFAQKSGCIVEFIQYFAILPSFAVVNPATTAHMAPMNRQTLIAFTPSVL